MRKRDVFRIGGMFYRGRPGRGLRIRAFAGALLLVQVLCSTAAWTQSRDGTDAGFDSHSRFVDSEAGLTPDDAVRRGLELNGELQAARLSIAQARGMVRQANLKANPMFEVGRTQGLNTTDNTLMIGAELPLELGGRREARVAVAERELAMRELEVRDLERNLAAEIQMKYGDAIATARNLKFAGEMLAFTRESRQLVQERVDLGKSAPLELGLLNVELSRAEGVRIAFESRAEVAFQALKRTLGMQADEMIRLRGEFLLESPLLSREDAVRLALERRPDLAVLRVGEGLAAAQVAQAQIEGKPDASLSAAYERMRSGFDVMGLNEAGSPSPIAGTFHNFKIQLEVMLPTRNRNEGAVDAARAQAEAARRRREFAESLVRSEVISAYGRFEKAKQALALYQDGVFNQAIRNLEVIRQTYVLGQRTSLDYVAGQRSVVELETAYTEVLEEYFDSIVEIDRATGRSAESAGARRAGR